MNKTLIDQKAMINLIKNDFLVYSQNNLIVNLEKLFKDMEILNDDKAQLHFCYLCQPKQVQQIHTISEDEYINGMLALKAIHAKDHTLREKLRIDKHSDAKLIQAVYLHSFKWVARNQNILSLNDAREIWRLFIDEESWLMKQFLQYVYRDIKQKRISYDIWQMVWRFSKTVKKKSDFDPDDAWPLFLQEFVDTIQE